MVRNSGHVALNRWRGAALASAPPVAASLLLVGPAMDSRLLPATGLVVVGGCLLLRGVVAGRDWPVATAALATATMLGLTAPATAIAADLTARARADPAMVVVGPALLALALVAGAALVGWWLLLANRPEPDQATVALLSAGLPLIWLPAFSAGVPEPVVWLALAWSCALSAVAWFAALLLTGWLALAASALTVLLAWAAVLSRLAGQAGSPAADPLLTTLPLGLALAASLAPLMLTAARLTTAGWRARRAGIPTAPPR